MSDDGSGSGEGADSRNSSEETEEDVAKRRSKNRVNARRSRERKRLMLDTLQQEHWQLHQENKRIKDDNEKIREVIDTIKSLQEGQRKPVPQPPPVPMQQQPPGIMGLFSGGQQQSGGLQLPSNGGAPVNNPQPQQPNGTSNPLMDLIVQQLAMQQKQQQQQQQQPQQQQQQPQQPINHQQSLSVPPAPVNQQQAPPPELLAQFLLANVLCGGNQNIQVPSPAPPARPPQNQRPQPAPGGVFPGMPSTNNNPQQQQQQASLAGLTSLLQSLSRQQGNQLQGASNPAPAPPPPPPPAVNPAQGLQQLLSMLGQGTAASMSIPHGVNNGLTAQFSQPQAVASSGSKPSESSTSQQV